MFIKFGTDSVTYITKLHCETMPVTRFTYYKIKMAVSIVRHASYVHTVERVRSERKNDRRRRTRWPVTGCAAKEDGDQPNYLLDFQLWGWQHCIIKANGTNGETGSYCALILNMCVFRLRQTRLHSLAKILQCGLTLTFILYNISFMRISARK